jgi:exopolyphosphatase / guanosine-5'-triphosphate,3'-diphosphate pyrophosphatase
MSEAAFRIAAMRTGVIDVGSNTVRLLVAARGRRALDTILSERTHLGLATDIERDGRVSDEKLVAVGKLAARYATLARDCGARRVEIVVTAPGRQSANASELHGALEAASGAPVRQLSAEEEGRFAYRGAVGTCRSVPESVAVCDVGGGSTQLMVGTDRGPAWLRTLDLGSLRLTERYIAADPPEGRELAAVARAVEDAFADLTPPLPLGALATGGTARALRRIATRQLGQKQFDDALGLLAESPSAEIAVRYGFPVQRARTLAAGAIVLREAHRRLGVKLEVARGGVREGILLELLAAAEAAA